MLTQLWLVRHGQTDWNLEGRYQGGADTPMNSYGISQVQGVIKQLEKIHFDALYSSHLQRAYQSAEILGHALGLEIIVDERLREISMGKWEGMLFTDIKQQYPGDIEERQRNPLSFHAPGGETVNQVAERMAAAADDICHRFPGGVVLVVSHGLALSTLFCQATGLPFDDVYRIHPDNAHPLRVCWQDRREQLYGGEPSG
jgi:broad specificity phosphatase PhoE